MCNAFEQHHHHVWCAIVGLASADVLIDKSEKIVYLLHARNSFKCEITATGKSECCREKKSRLISYSRPLLSDFFLCNRCDGTQFFPPLRKSGSTKFRLATLVSLLAFQKTDVIAHYRVVCIQIQNSGAKVLCIFRSRNYFGAFKLFGAFIAVA